MLFILLLAVVGAGMVGMLIGWVIMSLIETYETSRRGKQLVAMWRSKHSCMRTMPIRYLTGTREEANKLWGKLVPPHEEAAEPYQPQRRILRDSQKATCRFMK